VDGGQTSTVAVIGDESGLVLGAGTAGPCNQAAAAVQGCLAAACKDAGLNPDGVRFDSACLGFSGGAEDKRAIVEELVSATRLAVTNDAVIALSGATRGAPGIVAIAGTGSIAFGRNGSGNTARAGGWGYVFGDEGGAFDLVRQALAAVLRCEEGWGPATRLKQKLLEATGSATGLEMLHLFYTADFPRDRIASYAPLVDEAAAEEDEVAAKILERAARNLAEIVSVVRERLFRRDETVQVAHAGGVFHSAALREHFRRMVESDGVTRCGPALHAPAIGALIEAYRAGGLSPEIRDDVLRSHF
jgi:N-acetylglucosamine kinase-like BadF-type ATPase